MNRELLTDIQQELEKLDKKLEYYAGKYGTVFYDGYEYICCDTEEPVLADTGEKIYCGEAFRRDKVDISEIYEESDGLDQIEIMISDYFYERDAYGEVLTLGERGQLKWKGGYFGI